MCAALRRASHCTGNLLSIILGRYPKPHGVLFDLPHVVADASQLIRARGLVNRIKIESGSFFETAPAGGDVYAGNSASSAGLR